MNRYVLVVAAGMLSLPVCAAIADGSGKAPAATVRGSKTPQPGDSAPASSAKDQAAPAIVVHIGQQAKDDRDGRVRVGGTMMSMAPWIADAPKPDAKPGADGSAKRTDGAIEAPNNTLGRGVPLWVLSDQRDAELKLAAAQAVYAQTLAERADYDDERFGGVYDGYSGYGSFGFGSFGGGVLWGGSGFGRGGLRGPVTTSITRFDDLGSTAQRAYFNAAYPRLNGTQDAHDRAVSQFGRNATPPIARIQNDVDRAHTNANKEHPKK